MTPSRTFWRLTFAQDAIMGSLAHADPRPTDIAKVFEPIRFIFDDEAERFIEYLFSLRAMGLVWVDSKSGFAGYTAEGRAHVETELAEKGSSLAQLRLGAQANAPSTYRYPAPFLIGWKPASRRMTSAACGVFRRSRRLCNESQNKSFFGFPV